MATPTALSLLGRLEFEDADKYRELTEQVAAMGAPWNALRFQLRFDRRELHRFEGCWNDVLDEDEEPGGTPELLTAREVLARPWCEDCMTSALDSSDSPARPAWVAARLAQSVAVLRQVGLLGPMSVPEREAELEALGWAMGYLRELSAWEREPLVERLGQELRELEAGWLLRARSLESQRAWSAQVIEVLGVEEQWLDSEPTLVGSVGELGASASGAKSYRLGFLAFSLRAEPTHAVAVMPRYLADWFMGRGRLRAKELGLTTTSARDCDPETLMLAAKLWEPESIGPLGTMYGALAAARNVAHGEQ